MGYNVSFFINGYGTQPESLTDISVLPELPVLEEAGFIFEGWYLDEELTTPAEAGMEINSDVTLYASWARDRRPATPTTGDDSESSTYVAVDRPIGPGGGGGITGPTVPPIGPNLPGGPIIDNPISDKQNPLMYTIGSIPYYYMYAEIDRDPSWIATAYDGTGLGAQKGVTMPNKISYANYTFECGSTNPNVHIGAKFTYPVGPFWPAATSGDDIWTGTLNLENNPAGGLPPDVSGGFSDADVTMKVAKGGYYPLTSSRSAYTNHACVAFEASGTTASTIFIERSSNSLTIKQGTSYTGATVKGTYTKEAFPSLVIPYWVLVEVQAAGGAGQNVSGWKSGRPGGGGAYWAGAIYLGEGGATITMGKAGAAGTSTGTNASPSTISVKTHMGGTSSITIPGGYGGGDSSNYGVGGNLPTAPNMSDYVGYSTTYNGHTTVYACLCAYSVGGSGTTKASSHNAKDITSKAGNWTFYSDSRYAQFSKPAWYGVTFNRGSSQPNWGGAGGGLSSCGSGAKGQAGVGGSSTINTTTGYGAGGGGGGASQGTGGAGGKWWISIYY